MTAPARAISPRILPGLQALAVPIDLLRPMRGNPHHGDVPALMRSWDRFGQRRPLVGRKDPKGDGGELIAGNHGLEAAQKLGWTEIAVLWTDDDDTTAKAFALADNHSAQLGTDDPAIVAEMLLEIRADDIDLFRATTFEIKDLADLLDPDREREERERKDRRGGDATDQHIASSWAVLVTLDDEPTQLDLLERLSEEGFECRALIS